MGYKHTIYVHKLLLVLLFCGPIAAQSGPETCQVQIMEPHSNQGVATRLNVKGTATLPLGGHLWVFVRPVFNFRTLDLWWPQGEGDVASGTQEWELPATFGGSGKNLGDQFDVTAAVLASAQHATLVAYLKNSMAADSFQPITMPVAICAAKRVTVRKETD